MKKINNFTNKYLGWILETSIDENIRLFKTIASFNIENQILYNDYIFNYVYLTMLLNLICSYFDIKENKWNIVIL